MAWNVHLTNNMQQTKQQTKRRIILTEDERDLVRLIEIVERELRMTKAVEGKVSPDRVLDLLNIKDMVLRSLLKRVEG